jgi:hypothetical protein
MCTDCAKPSTHIHGSESCELLPFLTYATTVGDEQQVASNVFRRRTAATNGRPRIPATNSGDERPATNSGDGVYASSEGRPTSWASAGDRSAMAGAAAFFPLWTLGSPPPAPGIVGLVFYRRPARDVSGAECAHVLLIVGRNVRVVGLDILA